jgi:hypothetical protein
MVCLPISPLPHLSVLEKYNKRVLGRTVGRNIGIGPPVFVQTGTEFMVFAIFGTRTFSAEQPLGSENMMAA